MQEPGLPSEGCLLSSPGRWLVVHRVADRMLHLQGTMLNQQFPFVL